MPPNGCFPSNQEIIKLQLGHFENLASAFKCKYSLLHNIN